MNRICPVIKETPESSLDHFPSEGTMRRKPSMKLQNCGKKVFVIEVIHSMVFLSQQPKWTKTLTLYCFRLKI